MHMSRHPAKFHRQSIVRKAKIQVPTSALPENLKGVFEHSAKGNSKIECAQIHCVLLKHENVFSKDDYDLGHTWLDM